MTPETTREITIAYHSSTRAAVELMQYVHKNVPFLSVEETLSLVRSLREGLMSDYNGFYNKIHGAEGALPVEQPATSTAPASAPQSSDPQCAPTTPVAQNITEEKSDEKILALAERSISSASNAPALDDVAKKVNNASRINKTDKARLASLIEERKKEIESHGK